MIEITKNEAKTIRKYYPDACIAKTRHKRYLEESLRYLVLLPHNVAATALAEQMIRQQQRAGGVPAIIG